ncbi:efflux RND transporter periplasmic adaptor subunit [Candidatus Protochlamydia phocaeensis]|uniref:efflux RND transporter periplasmic adaptor subunit n=1 Tax=Candidatus Protochlamydia phocaeensis TaxID=1414722 RepID=UPI00083919C0|nr:efflux RND transporter periplasmic adaptor subunit [Candidatus Protochlamydia phocaeensis]
MAKSKFLTFSFTYIALPYAALLLVLACCSINKGKPHQGFPIAVAEVTQQDVPLFIEAIGNVYSLQVVQLRPQVGGIVQEVFVAQGQYVKKGDPLYKIDPRPFQANLDRAQAALIKDTANLKFAEEQAKRYSEVVKKEYVSKLTYDQYVSQVELNKGQILSDQADIAIAKLNLEWCMPVSPMDGKISQYNIDPGNLVTANDPNAITDIRQITPADIRFSITQKDFIEVQKALKRNQGDLKFIVLLPQLPKEPREGKIYFVDNHMDPNTGTIMLKGEAPNEDELLWPGEFVRVRLLLDTKPNAILVPEEAVKIGQDGSYVYVYRPEDSTAEYRRVVKGQQVDHLIVIESGLKVGEKVITKGQQNLLPGSKVYIASNDESQKKEKA